MQIRSKTRRNKSDDQLERYNLHKCLCSLLRDNFCSWWEWDSDGKSDLYWQKYSNDYSYHADYNNNWWKLESFVSESVRKRLRKYWNQFLRKTSLHRRDCYFKGEKRLDFFQIYTKNNCENECKAKFMLKACGCVFLHIVRKFSSLVLLIFFVNIEKYKSKVTSELRSVTTRKSTIAWNLEVVSKWIKAKSLTNALACLPAIPSLTNTNKSLIGCLERKTRWKVKLSWSWSFSLTATSFQLTNDLLDMKQWNLFPTLADSLDFFSEFLCSRWLK